MIADWSKDFVNRYTLCNFLILSYIDIKLRSDSLFQSETDYQTETTQLHCHWTGFSDPHSGIQDYRVGLGTSPAATDVQPLRSVGLHTSRYSHYAESHVSVSEGGRELLT